MATEIPVTESGLIIAVDFDGTLSEYDGYRGVGVYGPPREGAVEAMQRLKLMGHRLVIWTCREGPEEMGHLMAWLEEHKIPYDAINRDISPIGNERKIVAHIYIDDRQVGGLPAWPEIVEHIANHHETEKEFCR